MRRAVIQRWATARRTIRRINIIQQNAMESSGPIIRPFRSLALPTAGCCSNHDFTRIWVVWWSVASLARPTAVGTIVPPAVSVWEERRINYPHPFPPCSMSRHTQNAGGWLSLGLAGEATLHGCRCLGFESFGAARFLRAGRGRRTRWFLVSEH
jgi:hypothetical protein